MSAAIGHMPIDYVAPTAAACKSEALATCSVAGCVPCLLTSRRRNEKRCGGLPEPDGKCKNTDHPKQNPVLGQLGQRMC
jgi:hypothetical protein